MRSSKLEHDPSPAPEPQPAGRVGGLVEHLFRRQYGKLVSRLTRILGPQHLQLAEEVVQDALAAALQRWPFHGVPDNPGAWLAAVARNKALDRLRRRASFQEKQDAVVKEIENLPRLDPAAGAHFDSEVAEDQLRMMFLCCHPCLTRESAVSLILKTVGGFGVGEIARGFLARESAVAQRLVRAKKRLRQEAPALEMPVGSDAARRLEPVLDALYLIFNEGHCAHKGDRLIRKDLCEEAIRLTQLLSEHPVTERPKVHALLALMLLQAARTPARIDSEDNLLLLSEQDRELWDRELLERGFRSFERSIAGDEQSAYHVEAAIAAQHCMAEKYEDTDWTAILSLYDVLLRIKPSPVVALNRSVAVAFVRGPEAALEELTAIENDPLMRDYFHLPAVMGSLHRMSGRNEEAARFYQEALSRDCSRPERRFLRRLLEACRG